MTLNRDNEKALNRHYEILLGLEKPWHVMGVDVDVDGKRVELRLDHEAGARFPCSECGVLCGVHDHTEERRWRHLDTMQFETMLVARTPRAECPEHGVRNAALPWAGKNSRFTLLFEAFAIKVIQACRSQSQAEELLGLDWSSIQTIVERAVERGLARRQIEGIEEVGLDEKSFCRGQDYVSLMSDLRGNRVLEVVQGNDTWSGRLLWWALPTAQRKKVKVAAMDMSAGFMAATQRELPHVAIVHDKFHAAKLLNEAVDQVRRRENRHLMAEGCQDLKGTRYLWLFNPANLSAEQAESFSEIVARNLKTARAWEIKETFAGFWKRPSIKSGEVYFRRWYARAIRSRLAPIKKAARTFKAHLVGLLNYLGHPVTNAATEGLNSRIQALKANARGFRNFWNYRTRILFFHGNLDLMPASH